MFKQKNKFTLYSIHKWLVLEMVWFTEAYDKGPSKP